MGVDNLVEPGSIRIKDLVMAEPQRKNLEEFPFHPEKDLTIEQQNLAMELAQRWQDYLLIPSDKYWGTKRPLATQTLPVLKLLFPEIPIDQTIWTGVKRDLNELQETGKWDKFVELGVSSKILFPEHWNNYQQTLTDRRKREMNRYCKNKLVREFATELSSSENPYDLLMNLKLVFPTSHIASPEELTNLEAYLKGDIHVSRGDTVFTEGVSIAHGAALSRILFPQLFTELHLNDIDWSKMRNHKIYPPFSREKYEEDRWDYYPFFVLGHYRNMALIAAKDLKVTDAGISLVWNEQSLQDTPQPVPEARSF